MPRFEPPDFVVAAHEWAKKNAENPGQFPPARARYQSLEKELRLVIEMERSFCSVDDPPQVPERDDILDARAKRDGIESVLPEWMTAK